MNLHRDSQKRFYPLGACFFITSVTRNREPYFFNDTLCSLFIDEINICQKIKQCEFLAYKINPDHSHFILHPSPQVNFSKVMHSLRLNFSRNANRVMGFSEIPKHISTGKQFSEDEVISDHINSLIGYRHTFKSQRNNTFHIPRFSWQKSFRDHVIRGRKELKIYTQYIQNQWQKHSLKENRWLWISLKLLEIML